MSRVTWRRGIGGYAAILSLFLVFITSASAENMLRRSTAGEPDTLDPQKTFGATAVVLGFDLFEGLMTYDADGSLIMGAAASMAVSDDGLVYTFKIRDGLKWSDGTPLTAEHWHYAFERLFTPETGSIYAPTYFFIKNAKAFYDGEAALSEVGVHTPDPLTVEIELNIAVPYFPKMLASITGYPLPRHVIEAEGNQWTRPENMVSNGAYRLVSRMPNDFIELEKNVNYRGAEDVKIDKIRYYPSPDHSVNFKRFRAGELDVALSFPPNQLEWVRQNMSEDLRLAPRLASVFIAFNNNVSPFDDVRVRKALSLAIDRDVLVNRILKTAMRPAYGIVPPEIANYSGQTNASLKQLPDARMDEARQLLADAGYSADNPLKIALSVYTLGDIQKSAIALQNMWGEVGVETDIVSVEFRDYIRRRQTGDFQILISSQYAGYDDAINFLQQFETRYIRTGNNPSRYSNPAFDDLIKRGNDSLDPNARRALMEEAERLMLADHPAAPLYFLTERRLVGSRVEGWIDTSLGFNPTRHLSLAD